MLQAGSTPAGGSPRSGPYDQKAKQGNNEKAHAKNNQCSRDALRLDQRASERRGDDGGGAIPGCHQPRGHATAIGEVADDIADGAAGARDFNAVATPAAREAFEQNIVTQVLDRAAREGADLSSESIRQALRQNEDMLRQFPGVRDKLESIAIARDGLAKIEGTPIGKLGSRDLKTRDAVNALFPANPLPNSAAEIGQAVGALSTRNPMVARQLVRTHAEMTFNEASQRLASSGPTQTGGAKFAAILRGNPQQAANLEAAVRALPNGNQIWPGFNRFLEILEAQQFRQATGSRTAFKIPGVEDLKGGGLLNNAMQTVATGGFKWPQKALQGIQNWNVGRNLDELARLLTDPTAGNYFRSIATAPRGSSKALALTARLAVMANSGARVERRPGVAAR